MPTHLYCLLPASSAGPASLAGLGGSPVRVLRAGAVDAWVSTVPEPPPPGDPARMVEDARAHDAVVAAAAAAGTTPLPARFGQRFADDAACVRELAHRADALAARLARVAGHVEMTLAIAFQTTPATQQSKPLPSRERGAGAGRAYLERIKAALEMERDVQLRIAAVRRRVTETVGALVRDEVVQFKPSPSATLSISHLVPRASLDAYREAVAGLRGDPALPPLVLIGPLAPWRFAEVSA